MKPKYQVCPACKGEGTTTLHGVSFSESELNEAIHDNPDFLEHYMGGAYDTPCETCDGKRVVTQKELDEAYDRYLEAQIHRMESGGF